MSNRWDTGKKGICDRMKTAELETFVSFVKLHLSVVLEVSDVGDLDQLCVALKPLEVKKRKSLLNRMKLLSRRRSSSSSAAVVNSDSSGESGIFGVSLTQEIVAQIFQLFSFLERDDNVCQEGIFRKSGSAGRQLELRKLLSQGVTVDLDSDRQFSVHDVASVVKSFLRELPQPLLTQPHLSIYSQICHFVRDEEMSKAEVMGARNKQLKVLRLLVLLLPPENSGFLQDLLLLLKRIAFNKGTNRMNEINLGTIFAPLLFCSKLTDEEEFHQNCSQLAELMALMIRNADRIFLPPIDLIKDLEEHQKLKEKPVDKGVGIKKLFKRRSSVETDPDEIHTQIRFVDQTRSEEATTKFNTEAAMAELYATVNMMPESSKKKKLIKQFQKYNRENNIGRLEPADHSHQQRTSLKRHIGQRLSGVGLNFRRSASRDSLAAADMTTPSQSKRPGYWESRMSLLSSGSSLSSLGSLRSRNVSASVVSLGLSEMKQNQTADSGVMNPSTLSCSSISLFDTEVFVEVSTPIVSKADKRRRDDFNSPAAQVSIVEPSTKRQKSTKRRAPSPPRGGNENSDVDNTRPSNSLASPLANLLLMPGFKDFHVHF